MFRQSKTETMKQRADTGAALAVELARDRKFREALLAAIGHGAVAGEQARQRFGPLAKVGRLASDEELRAELSELSRNLRQAKGRLDRKRSHKLRNTLLLASAAGVMATPQARRWLAEQIAKLGNGTRASGGSNVADPRAAHADKPISRMTKDELIGRARDEGVAVTDDMSRDEVYEALRGNQQAD
jgi:polyhydroxyalkanoate synthesis regulator phasin